MRVTTGWQGTDGGTVLRRVPIERRDLRDMVASGPPPTAGQVAGVMARYETEPATTYASPPR